MSVEIQYIRTLCVSLCVCTCVFNLSAFTPRGWDHLFAPLPFHRWVTSSSTFRSCVFIAIWFALLFFPPSPVLPVLTPPESEKADSEDRVSLKVRSGRLFWQKKSPLSGSLSSYFWLVHGKAEPLTDLSSYARSSTRPPIGSRFTPSIPMWLFTSFCLRRRTTWSSGQWQQGRRHEKNLCHLVIRFEIVSLIGPSSILPRFPVNYGGFHKS